MQATQSIRVIALAAVCALVLSVEARFDERAGRGCNNDRYPQDIVLCDGDQRQHLKCSLNPAKAGDWILTAVDQKLCTKEETCRSNTTPGTFKAEIREDEGDAVSSQWWPHTPAASPSITCTNQYKPPAGFDSVTAWACDTVGVTKCDGPWAWQCSDYNTYQDKRELDSQSPGVPEDQKWLGSRGKKEWSNLKYCKGGCVQEGGKDVCKDPVSDLPVLDPASVREAVLKAILAAQSIAA